MRNIKIDLWEIVELNGNMKTKKEGVPESEQNSKKNLGSYQIQIYLQWYLNPETCFFVYELDPNHKEPKYSNCLLAETKLK